MAGLNLTARAGVAGSAGVNAALPPSYASSAAGATISSRAYGVGSNAGYTGPRTAAWGCVSAGVAGVVLLGWLWYSLPR